MIQSKFRRIIFLLFSFYWKRVGTRLILNLREAPIVHHSMAQKSSGPLNISSHLSFKWPHNFAMFYETTGFIDSGLN